MVSGVVYSIGTNWIDRCAIAQTYGYRRKRPCLPSSLIRKTIFDRTGLFAEDRRAGYDAAWLLHLKYLGITRGVNQHAVVEYIGVNFASSLSHLFLKSMRYAKPSVGLPGYYIPYVYAVLSFIFAATILAAPTWALLYFLVYFGARTFAIPVLKSRSIVFFSENPIAAMLGSGLVGSIMDCGRVLGTWQGIHFRFLALAREGRR